MSKESREKEKARKANKIVAEPSKYAGICFCTPMFGKICHMDWMSSFIHTLVACSEQKIPFTYRFLGNESLVPRGRNILADWFLNTSNCEYLMFIDGDLQFKPEDIVSMYNKKEKLIAGFYPKKAINWHRVAEAYKQLTTDPTVKNFQPSDLAFFASNLVFNPIGGVKFSANEPFEVKDIGTGFMMIHRDVFDAIRKAWPGRAYHQEGHDFYDYFVAGLEKYIDELEQPNSPVYLSEDYGFCALAKKLGFKVMAAPWVCCSHIGQQTYTSNFTLQNWLEQKIAEQHDGYLTHVCCFGNMPTEEQKNKYAEEKRKYELSQADKK